MDITLTFEFEKETKGAVRFKEITTSEPVVGTLYVRKAAIAGKTPQKLTVTIKG